MENETASHRNFMEQAMTLAEQARLHAPPNPWVGCVIVKDGRIVGQGYTQPPGKAHAEICALQQAQDQARGATLYVTLEPCAHHGRTPPCTEALISAGIRDVYFGIHDPDIRVKGKGAEQLEKAGIKVVSGLCQDQIEHSLAPYLYQRQTGLPFTILKTALSIDGRTAAANDSSQWITCTEARQDVHLQRARSQAIIVGAGTALKDLPKLTVRHPSYPAFQNPLRVLLDAKGKVPAQGPLFDCTLAPTLIITTDVGAACRKVEWESTGAEVVIVSAFDAGLDLQETWKILGQRSILQAFVEGGATLSTNLLESGLINRLLVYIGPILLGSSGHPFYQKHIPTIELAHRLSLQSVQSLGESVRLEYSLERKNLD